MVRWWSVPVVLCVAACSAAEDLPWWRTASLYQVYPRSFKDSDGDGVGDLKGITQMAHHFKEIGVDAIWLCPIFKSPMTDFGYDISNFTDIDPLFGTMEDFEALSAKLKDLGIKLLLDFVPNHSSDQHPWFQKSLNNETDYSDFYIWRDPKGWVNGTPVPPNNWLSVFGGSAWEWAEQRQQFYYHVFKVQQPDLNYRNEQVLSNMTAVLDFWMSKGVAGFRVDAVPWMYENNSFPDDPYLGPSSVPYYRLDHLYDMNQPENFQLLKYWTDFIRNKTFEDGLERVIFLEAYAMLNQTMIYYGRNDESMQIPFNFQMLLQCEQFSRSSDYKRVIDSWMAAMPSGAVPNWVIGNHDVLRAADHFGPEMVDSMNLLTSVLPGVKVSYYGEEIGMTDTYVRTDEILDTYTYNYIDITDILSRDSFRTPFQWDDSLNAGFSTKKPWLPVNPNYWCLNVAAQKKAESSHLKVYQTMMAARKDPVLQRGGLDVLTPDNDTLIIVREYNDSYFVLVINMGSSIQTYTTEDLFLAIKQDMQMRVVVGSTNSRYTTGTIVRQGSISLTLRPKAAVLLRSFNSSPSSSTIPCLSSAATLLFLYVSFFVMLKNHC